MTSQFQVKKRQQDLFLFERQFTSLHEEHLKQYITFQLQIKSYVRSIKTYLLAKFHDYTSCLMQHAFVDKNKSLKFLCYIIEKLYTLIYKRNSSGDEIANVNFLCDDIVHALKIQ